MRALKRERTGIYTVYYVRGTILPSIVAGTMRQKREQHEILGTRTCATLEISEPTVALRGLGPWLYSRAFPHRRARISTRPTLSLVLFSAQRALGGRSQRSLVLCAARRMQRAERERRGASLVITRGLRSLCSAWHMARKREKERLIFVQIIFRAREGERGLFN